MWQLVNNKYGTNAISIHRTFGISYSASWELLHKLRHAMVRRAERVFLERWRLMRLTMDLMKKGYLAEERKIRPF
jgi:hypothetical protein